MPLILQAAQQNTITIDTLEINAFSIDLEQQQIHISYDEGEIVNDIFVAHNKDRLITVGSDQFTQILGAAESAYVGSIYNAIKAALYDFLIAETGVTGTVS